jgi:fido (protein-threonine AMPylation protein)
MTDDDPYVYPGTSVLRNHFGIRDAAELAQRESGLTAIRIAELERRFEGNGRTQRAFLGQISSEAGHPLTWTGLDLERNIHASRESHRGNNLPLQEMLNDLVADDLVE